jgi:hypothetical protein
MCCTTRSGNAHRTEVAQEREVLYPWHPWAGCVVHVHEAVEKAGGIFLRCSLDSAAGRTVIQEVIADINADAGEIVLLIHWMGGTHTVLRLPRQRRGQRNNTTPDIVGAVRQLVRIANDDLIAGLLNRNKLTTGHGNRWTRERTLTAFASQDPGAPCCREWHRALAQSD